MRTYSAGYSSGVFGSGVEYKANAVSERGRIKGRFHALAVNICQEEAQHQWNRKGMLEVHMRVQL